MLISLHVKNLALIEETEVNFEEGLNILTGETGAGKSIIIGSINYCLGAKVDYDVIRQGAEYALIELVFRLDTKSQIQQVEKMDLPVEEDGILILTRKILPGRSVLKVCGETVTARQMKELASFLIDIHGQHEHQSLLSAVKQAALLDDFADAQLADDKALLQKEYKEYGHLMDEIKKISMDDASREREIVLAQHEVNEIEAVAPVIGEEEALNETFKKMKNAQRIMESVGKAMTYLKEGNENVIDFTGYAVQEMNQAASMDRELDAIAALLSDGEGILTEAYRGLSRYVDEFSYDEEEFRRTEERLDVLNRLMMKYGGTVESVIEYGKNRREELEQLQNAEAALEQLQQKRQKAESSILHICDRMHATRSQVAKKLSSEISSVLEELNFLKVSFEIQVQKKENFTANGYDEVIFMISLNPGETLKPITQVASGGELSRIMLALKTVFAQKDNIDTLIFDEIDAGISGKTAWKVSERMGELAGERQVICITHLPQIAAMSDAHFMIEKTEQDGKTITNIRALKQEERIAEIARLLGSDCITDTVLKNAKELKDLAEKTKTKMR